MKILLVAMFSLGLLALGCGSSHSNNSVPGSMGSFTNASLKGQYAYTFSGIALITNSTSSAAYTEGGVFTADGAQHITAGTDDFSQNGHESIERAGWFVEGLSMPY